MIRILTPKRRNKYNATTAIFNGIKFASLLEKDTYALLLAKHRNKELHIIQIQPKVYLTRAAILYKPDGLYLDKNNHPVYWEAKGRELSRWKLIKKLWPFYGPSPLEIYKSRHGVPDLVEVIQGRTNNAPHDAIPPI